jgi:hypothetical protein
MIGQFTFSMVKPHEDRRMANMGEVGFIQIRPQHKLLTPTFCYDFCYDFLEKCRVRTKLDELTNIAISANQLALSPSMAGIDNLVLGQFKSVPRNQLQSGFRRSLFRGLFYCLSFVYREKPKLPSPCQTAKPTCR